MAGADMSVHQGFRRQPVPQQVALQAQAITIPAPTRGIIESENLAFMQPGAAIICDNWAPTMRGVKLRGGFEHWCVLPETVPVVSAFEYASGNVQRMYAGTATNLYDVSSPAPTLVKSGQTSGNYCAAQLSNMGGDYMIVVNDAGNFPLRFDGTTWETLDPTYTPPVDKPPKITGPVVDPPVSVQQGANLTYVWKYRGRLFFVEGGSMNAWYLDINAVGGVLQLIPLSGAATKGGKLLFGATWSVDAGDGIDDKCVFCTDLGELLIFTGSNPADSANWRQEGRYAIAAPLGINAHVPLGGDLLIATVDGIVPISAAITKDTEQLDLAAVTLNIKTMWREEVAAKRILPWTMKPWHEYGAMFVTWPGGTPGNRYCAIVNIATGAWARFVGYDATCFIRMRADLFFGTQDGVIMQADRTGYDDGQPYVATLVGGWGCLGQRLQMTTWHQARASFASGTREPFQPQLSACTDYVVTLPTPPLVGQDPGLADVWDQGLWGPNITPWALQWKNGLAYSVGTLVYDVNGMTCWSAAVAHTSAATGTFAADRAAHPTYWTATATPVPPPPTPSERADYAQWDQAAPGRPAVRNTMWVSIGFTGYTHAPIVQVSVGQVAKPQVELIAIDAIHTPMGTNV
jgi:hypothetical protein